MTSRYKLTRYIPTNSKEIKSSEANGIVYAYENGLGQFLAIGYVGKRSNPDFHLRFQSKEQREKKITSFFNNLIAWEELKKERKIAKSNHVHNLNPGDILHGSWGYDQTNCEFYQVISRTDKSVRIREIAQTSVDGSQGFMSESRRPEPENVIGEQITRRVSIGNDCRGNHKHISLSLWSGAPRYSSWYA